MLTHTNDEMQAAHAAIPADGQYHELGAPYAPGARARRMADGGLDIDLSGASIMGKRDRGPAALARALKAAAFTVHGGGLNIRKGGVQSIQRARGMTPRVVL